MGEITWQQINQTAHLDAIQTAITSWDTYMDQIREQAEALADDVPGTIGEDHFAGEIAESCRSQLSNVAAELQDHLDETGGRIKTILEDAHEGLSECHDDMNELVNDVLDAKFFIDGDDEVDLTDARIEELYEEARTETAKEGDPGTVGKLKVEEERRDKAEPMTERLTTIVETARGHDEDATSALNGITESRVESPPPLGSAWHSEVAQFYVDRATDLLAGGEDGEISSEELDEFNDLLDRNGHIPHFATSLMHGLGAAGLMTGVADIAFEAYRSDDNELSPEQAEEMYERLGATLATATDPNNEPHVYDAWVTDLMNLGGSDVLTSDGSGRSNGYQLLAPMLPNGDFHADFLVPVSEHMLALDGVRDWSEAPPLSAYSGVDGLHGSNPFNYALEALDRNPDAAANFFTGEGTRLADYPHVDLDGLYPVEDPLEHLMEQATDTYSPDGAFISAELFGNALESGATGMPSDTPLDGSVDQRQHLERHVALTERLIEFTGDNPERFEGPDAPLRHLVDNFGDIAINYIADINAGFTSETFDWQGHSPGVSLDFGPYESDGVNDLRQFMQAIGQDPESFGRVMAASEQYIAMELPHAVDTATAAAADGARDGSGDVTYAMEESFESHSRIVTELTNGMFEGFEHGGFAEYSSGVIESVDNELWENMNGREQAVTALNHGIQSAVNFVPGTELLGTAPGAASTAFTDSLRPDMAGYLGSEEDYFKSDIVVHLEDFGRGQLEALQANEAYADDEVIQGLDVDGRAVDLSEGYAERLNISRDASGVPEGLFENGDPIYEEHE
ncbi:hypothetical protein [Glycomyces buryatensis]|uniref:Uncharacterized protein n=1 Tax=Glycomyces buryatensis TaxID=2570927 RepID=A0A4S8QHN5_9ACTN|nr:hypothetical protein [Glycomyces buryatensis]THV42752.1 hypothetical protein FAB82_04710 [Glycomyces buryatensis]